MPAAASTEGARLACRLAGRDLDLGRASTSRAEGTHWQRHVLSRRTGQGTDRGGAARTAAAPPAPAAASQGCGERRDAQRPGTAQLLARRYDSSRSARAPKRVSDATMEELSAAILGARRPNAAGGSKYVRRGDAAATALAAPAARADGASAATAAAAPKRQRAEAAVPRGEGARESRDGPQLSRSEAVKLLRARGEPATLFGEDQVARLARLARLEASGLGTQDERKSVALTRTLVAEEEEERADAEEQTRARERAKAVKRAKATEEVVVAPGSAASAAVAAAAAAAAAAVAAAAAAAALKAAKGESAAGVAMASAAPSEPAFVGDADGAAEDHSAEGQVSHFIKRTLGEWETHLEARSTIDASSVVGRKDQATFNECRRYMKPFLRLLRHREVAPEILAHVVKITQLCERREYIQAGDAYIQLAIGNAAWPIGVTMVGIHARKGRERIGEDSQAHVMNDEMQRKYITSIKRLMTVCQTLHPAEPSKMIQ